MHRVCLPALVFFVLAVAVQAADTVRTAKAPLAGEVKAMTPTEVTLERSNKTETIPVNEIVNIRFEGEPSQLGQVRNAVDRGRYEDAAEFLAKIDVAEVKREEIQQDIAFYSALLAARQAAAAGGNAAEAQAALEKFVKDFPNNYHVLAAYEAAGDLMAATGDYEKAATFYKFVESQAPWVDYKMRAGIAMGRTLLKQEKFPEAAAVFDSVIQQGQGVEGELVAQQSMLATVGRANCLARAGQAEEGVKLVDALITAADPEQAELHALAYNALGNCHRAAGRPKEALMAFLHVPLVYPNFADAHAEALFNLVTLWKEVGDPERSLEARAMLDERYANTEWAKK